MTENNFHPACPILRVHDLDRSVDYYVNVLGFIMDWYYPGVIASVSRGNCSLMLSQGDQGNAGSWAWIGIGDVDKLFGEYRSTGAIIRQEPTNFSWACEMQVQDPDGNVLRFGSGTKVDQPYGPWLDMHGHVWIWQENDHWKKENSCSDYEF
jgi:catechol 2,3-dioxygenase-like lactoylglutathione lyase family enzyme